MKRIEKEATIHGTPEINLALYDHGTSAAYAYPIAIEAHWHPEYEINYVYEGSVTFFMGGRNYTLHANELLFVDEIDCIDLFEGKNDRERILIFEVV